MKDMQHWTALFHATHLGFNHIVNLLLEHGANMNCTYENFILLKNPLIVMWPYDFSIY